MIKKSNLSQADLLNDALKPGDIFLVKGMWLVKLLIFIRYGLFGVKIKDVDSHVEFTQGRGFNGPLNVSAESKGVVLKRADRYIASKTLFMVVRLKAMKDKTQFDIDNAIKLIIGKKYAFPRYLLDFNTIFGFILWITVLVSGPLAMALRFEPLKWVFFGSFGLVLALWAARGTLRKLDNLTMDCTEATRKFLDALGLWPKTLPARAAWPGGMREVLEALVMVGAAEIIYASKEYER